MLPLPKNKLLPLLACIVTNSASAAESTSAGRQLRRENEVPCLSDEQCRNKFSSMKSMNSISGYYYVNEYPTKGCFSKGSNVYFGTGGTESHMSDDDLPGVQQRIWCDAHISEKVMAGPTSMPTKRPPTTKGPTTSTGQTNAASITIPTPRPTLKASNQPPSQPAHNEPIPTVSLALGSAAALSNMTLIMMPDPTKQPDAELSTILDASLVSSAVASTSATASLNSASNMDTTEATMMVSSPATTEATNEPAGTANPPTDETVVGPTEGTSDPPITDTIQEDIAISPSPSPSLRLPNNDNLTNKTSYLPISSANGNPIQGSNAKSSSMTPVIVCATLTALSAVVVVALLVTIRKRRQDSQGFDGAIEDGIEDDIEDGIEAHISGIDENGHENFEISLGGAMIDSQPNRVIDPDTSYFANTEPQQYQQQQQQQQHEYQHPPSRTITSSSSSNNDRESTTPIASSSSNLNQNWWLQRSISHETDQTPITSNVTTHGMKNAVPPRSFNLMDNVIDEEDGNDELE